MPYKKNYKKKQYTRKTPLKKTVAKIVDSKLNRAIETKHQNLVFNYTNLVNTVSSLYTPTQGVSDVSNRIGDTITPTSMHFKCFLNSTSATETTFCRILILRWKGNNIPSYLDVLEDASMNSLYNQDQRSNFNILHDKIHTQQPYGGRQNSKFIEFTVSRLSHKPIEFEASTISYAKNGIYLLYTGGRQAAGPYLNVEWNVLLRYKDA